jgi:hypothetical protein
LVGRAAAIPLFFPRLDFEARFEAAFGLAALRGADAFRAPDFFAVTAPEELFFRAGFAVRPADTGATGSGRWK